jgi:hypothetical protein
MSVDEAERRGDEKRSPGQNLRQFAAKAEKQQTATPDFAKLSPTILDWICLFVFIYLVYLPKEKYPRKQPSEK